MINKRENQEETCPKFSEAEGNAKILLVKRNQAGASSDLQLL
jgi:hypothetical protein